VSDAGALAAQLAVLGPACHAAGVTLLAGGAGPWPEPLPFGRRVRAFAELRAVLDDEDGRRGPHLRLEGLSTP
jgi:hypothetical protein